MTKLARDIFRQPSEHRRVARALAESGFADFERAAAHVRRSKILLIVGIGASNNAGLAVARAFNVQGRFAVTIDASEFENRSFIPEGATVIFLSRSGKSIELIHGVERCAKEGVASIALTNDPLSPVSKRADCPIFLNVDFDHAVSVVTYSSLLLVGALFALYCFDAAAARDRLAKIEAACDATDRLLPVWKNQAEALAVSAGFLETSVYFLARGESLCSAHAGMLLWEEVAKIPAAALTTGAFRHGPQEILRNKITVVIWLSESFSYENDLHLIDDLLKVGAGVIAIGPKESHRKGATLFEIPTVPEDLRGAFNCIPVQLLAESVARESGVDCDRFLFCNYIVEKDRGLT